MSTRQGHITRLVVLVLTFSSSLCLAQTDKPTIMEDFKPASTNQPGKQFPQVNSEGQVRASILAPQAQKVQLDLGKKYDMIKDTAGVWEVTTDTLSEGFHYYSLLIDGVAVADPASETFYGMGRMASGIEIPIRGINYCELRDVPHGEMRIKRYSSTVFDRWRQFYIYTPAGYGNNINEKYPVSCLLHGGGEDERGWATQGKTDLILDNLIAEKKARPMLVFMPDGNVDMPGFGEHCQTIGLTPETRTVS